MFPQKKRLSRALFPAILANGRKLSSPHFTVVFSEAVAGLPAGRQGYAVIVPKKVARLSVTRHRIKRRVFAALRTLPLVGQILPQTLIVFPRSSVSSVSYHEMEEELINLLSKIKIKTTHL